MCFMHKPFPYFLRISLHLSLGLTIYIYRYPLSISNCSPIRFPSSSSCPPASCGIFRPFDLSQTQSVLTNADKVNTFEGVIAEHELVKCEVQLMRDLSLINTSCLQSPEPEINPAGDLQQTSEAPEELDDASDARSILKLVRSRMD